MADVVVVGVVAEDMLLGEHGEGMAELATRETCGALELLAGETALLGKDRKDLLAGVAEGVFDEQGAKLLETLEEYVSRDAQRRGPTCAPWWSGVAGSRQRRALPGPYR